MKVKVFRTALAFALSFSFILMVACGTEQVKQEEKTNTSVAAVTKEEQKAPEKKESKTLTLATFNQWNTGGMKAAVGKYEEKTGNKIEIQVYPDDQFKNLIKTKLATGDVPDIIAYLPNVGDIGGEKMEPLDGPWVSRINNVKNINRPSDNKLVCAPYGAGSFLGALYNKKVFEKAGVALPLKSYKDLLAACEAIKKTGVTPLFLPNKDNWTAQLFILCSANGVFVKDSSLAEKIMKNEIKPSQVPEFVELHDRALSLKAKGYINDDYMSATFQMALEAIAKGEAGMFMAGDWFYTDIQKDYANEAENIGLMPVTLSDDYINVTGGGTSRGLYVPSDGKNKELAKEFINIFVSDEVMKVYYEIDSGVPPYKDMDVKMNAWNTEMLGYSKSMPLQDTFKDEYLAGFLVGDYNNFIQALFAGKPTKQSLDEWYKQYSSLMKAAKKEGF